jgi:signal transduction histidine kinase
MPGNSQPDALNGPALDIATATLPVPGEDRLLPERLAPRLERGPQPPDEEVARARLNRLRQINQGLYELIGIAGHEIRTPLTVVKSSVQLASRLLAQSVSQEKSKVDQRMQAVARAHELLLRVDRQIARLDRLVDDLLDVSRIRAGILEPRVGPCDLRAIVTEAVADQRLAWPTRTIVLNAPDEAAVQVLAEPQRIGQVVTNYLTNALKYAPEDKPVRVWLEVGHGEASVCVRDEGPGLPAEEHLRIWDRFQQAPGIKQQAGAKAGLGLGLYLCRTIIERHEGHVGVDSVPGRGSTFWFTLPSASVQS